MSTSIFFYFYFFYWFAKQTEQGKVKLRLNSLHLKVKQCQSFRAICHLTFSHANGVAVWMAMSE